MKVGGDDALSLVGVASSVLKILLLFEFLQILLLGHRLYNP